MAQVTLEGNPVQTAGDLPAVGSAAPAINLTKTDLSDSTLSDYEGKTVILNIFPSIDTPVCAASVRKFNEEAGNRENTAVLCISMDLPFAHGRFCAAEGLNNVVSLSAFRSPEFGQDYGVSIVEGPLKGILARAIVILDPAGKIVYTELVPEITQEPDYDSALAAI